MSRMLSDRKAPLGSGRKGSVFPGEVHVKEMRSATGAGQAKNYPDMEQDVLRDQEAGVSKAKSRPQKPGYRN